MEKFAKQNGLKLFKISAKLNKGIKEVFEQLTYDIIDTSDKSSLYNRSESVKLGYINNDFFQNNNNNNALVNKSTDHGQLATDLQNNCCFR
jgi:hypothetical protein